MVMGLEPHWLTSFKNGIVKLEVLSGSGFMPQLT
jgi:hypothetical protein